MADALALATTVKVLKPLDEAVASDDVGELETTVVSCDAVLRPMLFRMLWLVTSALGACKVSLLPAAGTTGVPLTRVTVGFGAAEVAGDSDTPGATDVCAGETGCEAATESPPLGAGVTEVLAAAAGCPGSAKDAGTVTCDDIEDTIN